MKISLAHTLAIIAFLGITPILCLARPILFWPYQKLVAESDLVVLVEPLANLAANDAFLEDTHGHASNEFRAINTTFKVHAVLKTTAGTPHELTVLHFDYTNNIPAFNGARFIRFALGPLQYEKRALKDKKPIGGVTVYQEAAVWLAFLKRRPDGRYIPVAGQFDSELSFREVHQPSFFASE